MFKKKSKKSFALLCCLALFINFLSIIPVSATTDLSIIYDEEISQSIISGDGTAEHPFVINHETAPLFTNFLEDCGKEALKSMQSNNTSEITTYGVMDGVLSGKSHTNQTNGGYWLFNKNATPPSSASNGNIWMHGVQYVSKNETIDLFASLSVSSTRDKVISVISEVLGASTLSKAVSKLTAKGLSTKVATSICTWLGWTNVGLVIYVGATEGANWVKKAPYEAAYKAGKGLISCEYSTSYQGKWYKHTLSEVWEKCPTAVEPAHYYGSGTYRSK